MITTETAADPRTPAAYREAGHAVARCLAAHGHGVPGIWGGAFAAYAGPWAEAQYIWGTESPADAVRWLELSGLFPGPAALLPPEITAGVRELQIEQVWMRDLDVVWPAIEAVAARLLTGAEITNETVGEDLRACLIAALSESA